MDYLLDLFESYQVHSNQTHFTFAHLSTVTHDNWRNGEYLDKSVAQFLDTLFTNHYADNTVIILYSDHGFRFGSLLKTKSAVYEQRLPLMYIYVPDTLHLDGLNSDQLRQVLRENQNRLTSHLDVHPTLLHLLYGDPPSSNSSGYSFGQSLFTSIPGNRTCEEAGIRPNYCMCTPFIPLKPITTQAEIAVSAVIRNINHRLQPYKDRCEQLELGEIISAWVEGGDKLIGKQKWYRIQFETYPNHALYECTLALTGQMKLSVEIEGQISRLDEYRNQTGCITEHPLVEPFCSCIDQMSNEIE